MNVDYNSYLDMDVKDLEKVINHAKNIINLREQKIIDAFKNSSLEQLKKSFVNNRDQKIQSKTWDHFDPYSINQNNLDFFLFIKKLSGYKDLIGLTSLSNTDTIVLKSFEDKKMFEVCLSHEELKPSFEKLISNFNCVNKHTSFEVIDYLFKNKLLNPNIELLNYVIKNKEDNYLNYFFDNNIYPINKYNLHDIYLSFFSTSSVDNLNKIRGLFPEYKKITLLELVNEFQPNMQSKDELYTKYKMFIKLTNDSFLDILDNHFFEKNDITYMIKAISNTFNGNISESRFNSFVDFIVHKHPEYIQTLIDVESEIKNVQFKPYYLKTKDYLNLQLAVCNNSSKINNKIKI